MNWKWFGKLHGWLYRVSGGRISARMGPIDIALVDTVGRKSGKLRTVPIACYPYKDSVVISASNSGLATCPAWYHNLKARPQCQVQLGRERFNATAEDLTVEECEQLLPSIYAINPHQQQYREKTDRHIPIVWLRRASNAE